MNKRLFANCVGAAWLLLALLLSSPSLCVASPPDYMAADHAKVLQEWLDKNKRYRLATIEDCECSDDVTLMRSGNGEIRKPQPKYQPDYAVGDFNGDGMEDFAVLVRPIATEAGAMVLVFLGGQRVGAAPIQYAIPDNNIVSYGLFIDRSRKTSPRLLVGLFASEAEYVPIPRAIKK